MSATLYEQIQQFYDASSGLWEQIWGEHMHHGYYGADGTQRKDRRQAQIDLIEEILQWSGVKTESGETHPKNILDVGCGIGGTSVYLFQSLSGIKDYDSSPQESYKPKSQAWSNEININVTGITLSPVQANRATERAAAAGLSEKTSFLVADAQAMPFADDSFDLVWSLESGEHMPNKTQFIQECYRVLKPGGTFIMVTWCHRPMDTPLTTDEQKHLQEIYQVYCLPYVISLPEYEAIARKVGLQNVRTADWSRAVAPFWDVVIDSALTPSAIWGLLLSGWSTIQAALSLGLMRRGYERGLIRFGLLCGNK
ncbi:MAG: methyltransferase domain-containing protein [Stigonema ocellatum SAG 48.90 = DSM 106950]|nr:methyltransferase domain-containing protein [Stigonema ocellatum SAG 48.90 = DSM 106950]